MNTKKCDPASQIPRRNRLDFVNVLAEDNGQAKRE